MRLHLLIKAPKRKSIEGELELPEGGSVIGRTEGEIRIHDPRCSSRHAFIYLGERGQLRIRDLSSRNGTFIAGSRILDQDLRSGSEVTIGHCRIIVRWGNTYSNPCVRQQIPEDRIERPEYDKPRS